MFALQFCTEKRRLEGKELKIELKQKSKNAAEPKRKQSKGNFDKKEQQKEKER